MFFRAFLPLTQHHHSEGFCALSLLCGYWFLLPTCQLFLLTRSEKSSNGLSFSPHPNLFLRIHWVRSLPPTTKVSFPTALSPIVWFDKPRLTEPIVREPDSHCQDHTSLASIIMSLGTIIITNNVMNYWLRVTTSGPWLLQRFQWRGSSLVSEGSCLTLGSLAPFFSSYLLLICYLT